MGFDNLLLNCIMVLKILENLVFKVRAQIVNCQVWLKARFHGNHKLPIAKTCRNWHKDIGFD